MINKPTIISKVETDGSGIGQIRKDLSQDIWEAGITLQLNNLTTNRPFQSSKPVVDALSHSGHNTLIVPKSALRHDDGTGGKYGVAEKDLKLEGCHAR